MENKNLKLLSLFICGIFISGLFIQIGAFKIRQFSANIVILQFGEDPAIFECYDVIENDLNMRNEFINDLNEKIMNDIRNLPLINSFCTSIQMNLNLVNSYLNYKHILVDSENLEELIRDIRCNLLIVIGHGSESGFSYDNQIYDWSVLNEWLSRIDHKFAIIDACFSKKALNGRDNAIGFSAEIDSITAGYLTSAIIRQALKEEQNFAQNAHFAYERIQFIEKHPESQMNLYLVEDDGGGGGVPPPPPPNPDANGDGYADSLFPHPYLGAWEVFWGVAGIVYIILLIATLLASIRIGIIRAVTSFVTAKGILLLISTVMSTYNFIIGNISLASWLGIVVSLTLQFIVYVTAILTAVEVLILAAEMAVHISTGGTSLVLLLLTGLYTIIETYLVFDSIKTDWLDKDVDPYVGW